MKTPPRLVRTLPKTLLTAAASMLAVCLADSAHATSDFWAELGQGNVMSWQFSPLTYHYSEDPQHKPVVMVGLEREHADLSLDGAAFFTNSFGQPTVYVYPWGGVYKDIGGVDHLSLKWTAGLLYGYRGQYEDKVPFNHNGFSPAVIPAIAYEFSPGWSAQVNILGTAGLMFQLSKPFK